MYRFAGLGFALAALLLVSACGTAEVASNNGTAEVASNNQIPARANVLLSVRVADILNDTDLTGFIDKLVTPAGETSALAQALDQAQEEAGFDPRALDRVLLFGDIESDDYFGVFIEGIADPNSLLSSIEVTEGPLAIEVYRGQEIRTTSDGSLSIATLGSGAVLLGSAQAVRDAIDIREGDAEPLAGTLVNAFEDLGEPLVAFYTTVPEGSFPTEGLLDQALVPGLNLDLGVFSGVRSAGLAFDKDQGVLGLDLSLLFPDEESAVRAVDAFDSLVTFLLALPDDAATRDALARIDVSRAGPSAIISYSATIDELETLIEGLGDLASGLDLEDIFSGTELNGQVIDIPGVPTKP